MEPWVQYECTISSGMGGCDVEETVEGCRLAKII